MSGPLICPHCSTTMPVSARFCPGCGEPRTATRREIERAAVATGVPYERLIAQARDEDARGPRAAPAAAYAPAPPATPVVAMSNRRGCAIVAMVIVGLIILMGVYAELNNSPSPPTPAPPTATPAANMTPTNTSEG